MAQHNVFISYSRSDTETMQRIRADFEAAGLSVWTDKGIPPGAPNWKVEIENAIREADCLVALFSPDAAQSRWVRAELDFADAQQKRVFPVLTGGDAANAVPFGFSTYQWIDIRARENYPERIASLITALQAQIAHGSAQSTESEVIPPRQAAASTPIPQQTVVPAKAKARTLNPVLIVVPLLLIVIVGALAMISRSAAGSQSTPTAPSTLTSASTQAVIDPELSADIPAGWTVESAGNVSIAIPPDWSRLNNATFEAAMSMTFGDAQFIQAPQQMLDYFKKNRLFYVGNWLKIEGAVVLVEDAGFQFSSPDLIRDRLQSIFGSSDLFHIQPLQVIELQAGQAYLAEGDHQVNGVDQNLLMGYLIIRGRIWYSVYFAFSTPEARAAAQPIIDQMLQSFRITDEATEQATEAAS